MHNENLMLIIVVFILIFNYAKLRVINYKKYGQVILVI